MSTKGQGKMHVVFGELLSHKAKCEVPSHAWKVLEMCDCSFAESGGFKQEEQR